MTTSAPEKPRLSPQEAGVVLAFAILFVARCLIAVAKKLGGTRVETRIESEVETPGYAYYTASSLEESLRRFESHFELPTSEFTKLCKQDRVPASMPRHAANVWAGLADDLARLHAQAEEPDEIFAAAIAS